MTILLSLLSWVVSNPMMILGAIGIWVATGWISDVQGFFEKRAVARPLIEAIEVRDQTAAAKDKLITEALFARDNAQVELTQLKAELDDAELKRKAAGAPDCVWSRDDIRLLNTRGRRR